MGKGFEVGYIFVIFRYTDLLGAIEVVYFCYLLTELLL